MKGYPGWVSGTYLFFAIFFIGCKTSQETSGASYAHKNIRNPRFIKGMAVGGNQNNISTPVIDGNNKYVYVNDNKEVKKDGGAIAVNAPRDRDAIVLPEKKITRREKRSLSEKYAGMMGVEPRDISNYTLYRFIDDWYGVNYRLGGSDRSGIDCSAFAQRLYTDVFGVCLLRTAIEQYNNSNWVRKTKKLREGDLVFFHIHSRHVTHVGIYLANNYFVHASVSQGVVISNLDDDYWKKHYAGGGRIPHSYDVSVK